MSISNNVVVLRRRARAQHIRIASAESVSHYLQQWLTGRRALRASTVRSYEGHIRRYLNPAIGHVPIEQLSADHINEMYDALLHPPEGATCLSTTTINRIHSTLMCALNSAVRAGRISQNPGALVELPRARRVERTVWDAAELMRFLGSVPDYDNRVLFALLGTRGLRRGEALGLRWSDVNLDAREIRVMQQLSVISAQASFGPPKSKAGNRVIAIDEWLAGLLLEHRQRQRTDGRKQGRTTDDHTLVFTDHGGRYLNPTAVTRQFDRLVAATDLPRIRLHDLRHTSASVGLASGESLVEVSRRLGHSSVAITGDIYAHVSSEAAKASADRMSDYLLARR